MKRVSLTFVLLLVAVACGMFRKSPGAVTRQFYELVEEGELGTAYDLLSIESKKMIHDSTRLRYFTERIKEKNGIKRFEILKEEVTGEIATVNFQISYGDGSVKADEVDLVKESGRWRLRIHK